MIRRIQNGVTLVELIIAIVVLSVTLTGIFTVSIYANKHSADPMIHQQAISIAQSFIDEIQLQSFGNPGGGCALNDSLPRRNWDSVCDYNNYGGGSGTAITDIDNNAMPGLADYKVRVLIDTLANLNGLAGPNNAVRIDVMVYHPLLNGVPVTLSSYRVAPV